MVEIREVLQLKQERTSLAKKGTSDSKELLTIIEDTMEKTRQTISEIFLKLHCETDSVTAITGNTLRKINTNVS